MVGFEEGYTYFEKNASAYAAATMSDSYVASVNDEINKLVQDLNSLEGFKTASNVLKGDVAEFWHTGTFNIDSALKGSSNRAFVDRSHDFASTDISTNFGDKYGLKYYSDGQASAKAQAVSVFQRFKEYQSHGGTDNLELSMLLLERDELQFVICKNIETEYMLKLGSIEYKAYEAQCAALRLKRKIELIQAKKNRQEKVIISAIEETLDSEFAEYQKQLNEQIDRMNDALKRSKAEVLSDEDNKELKKLYRKIVKALHPDINPDVSEAQVQLFDNAVSAYKSGDLETLRIIGEMVGNNPLPEQHKDAMAQLVEERERIQGLLKSIRESIDNIKSEYPYTMKDILEDTERTKQKKQELENILEQYNELISIYKSRIEEMLR